jgi:hypothetical protein
MVLTTLHDIAQKKINYSNGSIVRAYGYFFYVRYIFVVLERAPWSLSNVIMLSIQPLTFFFLAMKYNTIFINELISYHILLRIRNADKVYCIYFQQNQN